MTTYHIPVHTSADVKDYGKNWIAYPWDFAYDKVHPTRALALTVGDVIRAARAR